MARRRDALAQSEPPEDDGPDLHFEDHDRPDEDREISVTERNRLEAAGMGYQHLPFEGDDRLQIPAGTEDPLARAIRRYWSLWPKQRDAVLEQYAEGQIRVDAFRERYAGNPPIEAIQALAQEDPGAWSAYAATHYIALGGGPLGIEMTDFDGNFGPVHATEIRSIADAADDEIRARPPVRMAWGFRPELVDGKQISEEVAIVAGESRGIALVSIADVLPSASKLLEILTVLTPNEERRVAYRLFVAEFWQWRERNESPVIATSRGLLLQAFPKQTFHPLARVEQAYAAKSWIPTNDGRGLVHRTTNGQRKKDPIEVLLSPLEYPKWFPPATVDDLQSKLQRISADGPFTFAVTMSLAIENDHVDLELDDFIQMLGLDPRSSAQRAEYRTILWECLQLFSQTEVIGEIQGNFRDGSGRKVDRVERSPVILITGTQYPREMRLDNSETPVAVSFVAGSFLYRHRGNRKMLANFGDLRALAEIPGGKAAGSWARTIGLALYQFWREEAHKARVSRAGEDSHKTAQFSKVTRRQLFNRVLPDPSPFAIIASDKPSRARSYWDDAVDLLRQRKVVSRVGSSKRDYPRKAWSDLWLDEELDLRPHRDNLIAIEQIQEISDGARTFKRKRGRPKKNELTVT